MTSRQASDIIRTMCFCGKVNILSLLQEWVKDTQLL